MFISEPKFLHDVIKPIIYFNWFVGMGTYGLPHQNYATCIVMNIWTIIVTLVNWSAIYIALTSIEQIIDNARTSPMGIAIYTALVIANSCIMVSAPLLVWLQKKRVRDCLQQMVILDNSFQANLGVKNEYRRMYIFLIGQVIAINLVMLLVAMCDILPSLDIILHMSSQLRLISWSTMQIIHQPIQVMLLLDVNFCTFTRYLGKKFRNVNESLLGLTEEPSTSCPGEELFVISHKFRKPIAGSKVKNIETDSLFFDRHHSLRKIRKVHLELSNLSRKINLTFGVQNLLSTGISFVMITGFLYAIYCAFSTAKFANSKLQEVIPTAVWTVIYVFKIWMVNHSCWSVSTEAGRTGEVIYELLNSKMDNELQKEIQEFALQMLQNPVHFNACGFFTLDYTFVQGMIGSITTYLVILIQMIQVTESPTFNTAFARNESRL